MRFFFVNVQLYSCENTFLWFLVYLQEKVCKFTIFKIVNLHIVPLYIYNFNLVISLFFCGPKLVNLQEKK